MTMISDVENSQTLQCIICLHVNFLPHRLMTYITMSADHDIVMMRWGIYMCEKYMIR